MDMDFWIGQNACITAVVRGLYSGSSEVATGAFDEIITAHNYAKITIIRKINKTF